MGGKKTQHDAQQRRLSRAVRADQGRELAGGDLELDVFEDAVGTEGERDAFCGQDGADDGGLHLRSIPILGPSVIRLILIMRRWLITVLALAAVAAVVTTAVRIEPAGASRSRVGVAAAFYRTAEARAARLPKIGLTASGSSVSSELFVLKERDNPVWSVGVNLLAPERCVEEVRAFIRA